MPLDNAALLTDIELLIFRINGQLLRAGDQRVAHLGLTSARWQMLGAIALAERALTAPQLAEAMGVTRQAAQKQLNLLLAEGLVRAEPNPAHARSPHYVLTDSGRTVYTATEQVQQAWVIQLSADMTDDALQVTHRLLQRLSQRLSEE